MSKKIWLVIISVLLVTSSLTIVFLSEDKISDYSSGFENQNMIDKKSFASTWNIQNFSFNENGCEMDRSQVHFTDSCMILSVGENPDLGAKPFLGGEIGSKEYFQYGYFTVRLKNNIIPGTVSSFFLMNEWKENDWAHKEIDIEFLGQYQDKVQFTVHKFTNSGHEHLYKSYLYELGFNSNEEYHLYSILWLKDSISFYVDNAFVWSEKDLLINDSMNIRMNHWAGDTANKNMIDWLGQIDIEKLPSEVYYKNVFFSKNYISN